MTIPAHTRQARGILGLRPSLAPEQRSCSPPALTACRRIAREMFGPVLKLVNYRDSMVRMGFTAEQAETASDELLDAVIAYGTPEDLVSRLEADFDAGASHVSANILTASGNVDHEYGAALNALADALPLGRR